VLTQQLQESITESAQGNIKRTKVCSTEVNTKVKIKILKEHNNNNAIKLFL
jgi:hypothetical protein